MKTLTINDSQAIAFKTLANHDLTILNAPTGWGKSVTICATIGAKLLADPTRKAVIAVPQHIISKGFITDIKICLPNGKTILWSVAHNLCDTTSQRVKYLKLFLTCPAAKELANRVAVVTHHSLANAFNSLTDSEAQDAIDSTLVVIDEAHHIQANEELCNRIGSVIGKIINGGGGLLLATAFFFRGDTLPIISAQNLDAFTRHVIPFDEYWNGLRHLKKYKYEFVAYAGTPWRALAKLIEHEQTPTIIYCPPDGHRLLMGGDKAEFIRRVVTLLRRHYNAELWTPEADGTGSYIVDFVDTDHRPDKIKFVNEHPDSVAVVLTVGMFREGADWPHAQRVIDLIPSMSDQDRNQRFGRLIRDKSGKASVAYYSLFPELIDGTKEDQRRELSKLFAHFHASLIMESAISPIRYPAQRGSQREPGAGRPVELLGDFDQQRQEDILSDVCERLVRLAADKEASGTAITPSEAQATVLNVLHEHGVKRNADVIAKQIILMLRRRSNVHLPAVDLLDKGFDKVWHSDAIDGLRLFSAGFGGPATFRELRGVLATLYDECFMENYDRIKQLAAAPAPNDTTYWWVQNTKAKHKAGELAQERVRLLEEIPWWSWATDNSSRWRAQYDKLASGKNGQQVRDWIKTQRRMYASGKLSSGQIQMLESVAGWSWAPRVRRTFSQRYKELATLGRKPNSRKHPALAAWMKVQRKRIDAGKMPKAQAKLLTALPWW